MIVAHPDDETLWAGGYILSHPEWDLHIVSLCRGSDPDRAPRFRQMAQRYHAIGAMAGLDDGPEQLPLVPELVRVTISSLLPSLRYDLVLTHGPRGEYTRHRRHEEVSRAVGELWQLGALQAGRLGMFAYQDHGHATLPEPVPEAHAILKLPEPLWREKYRLITEVYGFDPGSWEARATPRQESFWWFDTPDQYAAWLKAQDFPHENIDHV